MSYQGLGVSIIVVELVVGYGVNLLDINGQEDVIIVTSLEEVFTVLDRYQAI